MKFVTIADTHGKHNDLKLPAGDILIHAGDISLEGTKAEVIDFLKWFGNQEYEHKILVAGNHDFFFEKESSEEIEKILPEQVIYLKDSGVKLNNLNIWGSPVTPWFYNWAFNRFRGDQINRHWELIPAATDILITHGPGFCRLDTNKKGEHLGCRDLFNRVHLVKPKVHICGHIHEAYGTVSQSGIQFINASLLNERYELVNDPITFDL